MATRFAFPSNRSRGIRRSVGLLVTWLLASVGCDAAPLPVHKGAPRAERAKAAARFEAGGGATTKSISPAAMADRARTVMAALPATMESPSNPLTEAKVELGRMLFHDARLSKRQDTSCATCHDLASYGIDVREKDGKRIATSLGHLDQLDERNTPSVYDAGLAFVQFWDGRAADLEAAAMAMPDEAAIVRNVESIPGYVEAFTTAFPDERDPVTAKTIALAIAAFERKLVTPGRFDAFMNGDLAALEREELRGLQLFFDAGCTQCHTGAGIGGTQFQKLGSVKPWPEQKDEGRFRQTKDPKDRFVFKVPSLRNVTRTGPYMHDGSIESLEEMVQRMAEHQSTRGRLKPSESAAIVAFLRTLEGELPTALIAAPTLPP